MQIKRFAMRVSLVLVFTAVILIARMASGTPTFKPVDNPASFSNSSITRVCFSSHLMCLCSIIIDYHCYTDSGADLQLHIFSKLLVAIESIMALF